MRNTTGLTETGRQYAAAYAAHCGKKNFGEALQLYRDVLAGQARTREARYSRAQIQNIIRAVIPDQKRFDVQVDLATAHFKPASESIEAAVTAPVPVPRNQPLQQGSTTDG